MRVKHTMNVLITDDAEGKDVLFGPDLSKSLVQSDGFERYVSGRFEIDVSSNEALSFGDVTDVRGIFVKADNDFNVTFNGGAEVLNVKRASAAAGTFAQFVGEFDITAINIANPSATAVLKGIWCAWGDPTS